MAVSALQKLLHGGKAAEDKSEKTKEEKVASAALPNEEVSPMARPMKNIDVEQIPAQKSALPPVDSEILREQQGIGQDERF